jgi:hypothetical protein
MKKIPFFILAAAIIYFGCSKKNGQSSSAHVSNSKTLFAIAGHDSTICMPFGGSGNNFQASLDGRESHDSLGNITSYVWTQQVSGASAPVVVGTSALSVIQINNPGPGVITYWLQVKDDKGQISYDSVSLHIIQNFGFEYDALTWDSAVGPLTTISERFKPGLIESWPDFTNTTPIESTAYIINYNGQCNDLSSWQVIPYVRYDSIQLTPASLFYTVIPGHGVLFPEVFAKTNSGMDFTQKVSIAFDINNDGAGDWDY